jgi:glucose-1-phosphate thymidylyltransferase
VGCLEEIAYQKGYINKAQLLTLAQPLKKNAYGQYLIEHAEEF